MSDKRQPTMDELRAKRDAILAAADDDPRDLVIEMSNGPNIILQPGQSRKAFLDMIHHKTGGS